MRLPQANAGGHTASPLSATVLHACQQVISERWGLGYRQQQELDLLRHLGQAASRLADTSPGYLAQQLAANQLSPAQEQALNASLTVGETYFYRDPNFLTHLSEQFLRPLIAQRRQQGRLYLQLWSAGCSSGEEAYTLAILLHSLLPDLEQWRIRLLATDINPDALHKARQGYYSAWSFRAIPAAWQHSHFVPVTNQRQWRIKGHFRRLVEFHPLNLASPHYQLPAGTGEASFALTDFDLILCRYVLMYFTPAQGQAALARLHHCLAPEGALVLAAVEHTPSQALSNHTELWPGALCIHQQARQPQPPAVAPPLPSLASPTNLPAASTSLALPPAKYSALPSGLSSPAAMTVYVAEAEAEAEAAPANQTTLSEQRLLSANQLANQGLHQAALGQLQQLLAESPTSLEANWLMVLTLSEAAQWQQALHALRRVLYLAPQHPIVHYQGAQICWRLGQARQAGKYLSQCRRLLAAKPADEPLWGGDGLNVQDLQQLLISPQALIRSLHEHTSNR